MCGIAGFIAKDVIGEPEAILRRMTDAIRHRGPDDDGIWFDRDDGIGLGHRRLSIVDLSAAGHQPMESATGRYQLVYNGEIYNHRALRGELEAARVAPSWRGHSDTEVLLGAIDAWGLREALRRCNGMFALALWDRAEKMLTLACDRFGEKPLYFGWQDKTLLFGSELKALYAHPLFAAEIDRNALALFLRHNYIPAPHSIWRGIAKLSPGHLVEIRPDAPITTPTQTPYWRLDEVIAQARRDPLPDTPETVDALEALLIDAIGLRMDADVPVGAFLSGGVDSSLITALMQQQASRPVRTFTIGFDDPRFNEADHAHAVATHLGTEHTQIVLRPEQTLAVLPRLPGIWDEPFSDSSQVPTFLVSQLTRDRVSVSLSGDGGDEVFGGYNCYIHAHRVHSAAGRVPMRLRGAIAAGLESGPLHTMLGAARPVLPASFRRTPLPERAGRVAEVFRSDDPDAFYRRLLSHDVAPEEIVIGSREPAGILGLPRPPLDDFRETMMYLDTASYLPGDILTKVDRATMAVGLESRIPLLDPRIVEFAWRLPLGVKMRGTTGKAILRNILYRHVPRALVDRPKTGFSVPLEAWLKGPLSEWRNSLLDPTRIADEGFFEPAAVATLQQMLRGSGSGRTVSRLWDLMMFQAWLDNYRDVVRRVAT